MTFIDLAALVPFPVDLSDFQNAELIFLIINILSCAFNLLSFMGEDKGSGKQRRWCRGCLGSPGWGISTDEFLCGQ